MGIFYYFHSVALAEDLPEVEAPTTVAGLDKFYSEVDRGFTQVTFLGYKFVNIDHYTLFFLFLERFQLLDCCSSVYHNIGYISPSVLG